MRLIFRRWTISAALSSIKGSSAPDPPSSLPLYDGTTVRLVGLDVLRAAAILLVASGHMLTAFPIPRDVSVFGKPIWIMMSQLAVAGVDLFLVLSGFLIGGLLLRELSSTGRIAVGRFYARRALRLWPAYFLAVLFAWKWYSWGGHNIDGEPVRPPSLTEMWPFFLQVQNYYDLHVHQKLNIGAVMQTWTLASLVQFYLLVPLLLLLLAGANCRKNGGRIRALPWFVAGAFIACFAMRWHVAPANAGEYDSWRHYFPMHLRLDELMAGVLAAYWVIHARPQVDRLMRYWPLILVASFGALLPVALRKEEGPPFLIIWGYMVAGLGCLGLVMVAWWLGQPCADGTVRRSSAPVRWFAQIGVWSYSIYLWHQPTAQYLAPKIRTKLFTRMDRMHLDPWHSPWQYLIEAIIYYTLAIGIGAAMYYLIEKPSLKLRAWLIPSPPVLRGQGLG